MGETPFALRVRAPEDGRYRVLLGGVIETPGTTPLNLHLKIAKNINDDGPQWADDDRVIASCAPGRATSSRGFGALSATVRLQKGETISAGGIADQPFILGTASLPGRTWMSVRWVGRY
ncbi:hypothetical protein [Streptomyces luteireticuli]